MLKLAFKKNHILLTIGLVLSIVGGTVIFIKENKNNPNKATTAPVITFSTDSPEEKTPSSIGYKWRGLGNDPKSIIIEKLGIDAFVQNVGVDQNNEIAVPNNIHIAGWFINTVRPGEKGLSIIDGHVNGVTSDEGVFKRLPDLVIGDTVRVVFGDNTTVSFVVKDNKNVATSDSASLLFSQNPTIGRQLNLITCTGNYNRVQREYERRQITILEKVN